MTLKELVKLKKEPKTNLVVFLPETQQIFINYIK